MVGTDSTVLINYISRTSNLKTVALNGDTILNVGATPAASSLTIGSVISNLSGNASGNHTGTFTGEVTGTFSRDDSSIVIDGLTGNVSAAAITGDSLTTDSIISTALNIGTASSAVESFVNVRSTDESNTLRFQRVSAGDISASAVQYGEISFGRDDVSGPVETIRISGFQDGMTISHATSGTHSSPSTNLYISDGKFGFGTFTPATNAKVDVSGNLHITGGYTQFGSLTSTERNALTAANGMVIYNTTNNKFEGYQNGGWINLDDGLAAS